MAPQVGFEPTFYTLTECRIAVMLPWNKKLLLKIIYPNFFTFIRIGS